MTPEQWTFFGLFKMTYNVLQMKLLTFTTMLEQRLRRTAFQSCQDSFKEVYSYSDDVCSVLLIPVAAEADVQCRETRGQWEQFKLGLQPHGELGVIKSCEVPSQF